MYFIFLLCEFVHTSRTSEMLDNGCSNFKSHILFWSIEILNSNITSPLNQIILLDLFSFSSGIYEIGYNCIPNSVYR